MKFSYNLRFPQKSLFGFKILSSFQSSLAVYFLSLSSMLINPFFGNNNVELFAGFFFNFINSFSILILICNLLIKRKELKRKNFYMINFPILIVSPYSFYLFFCYFKIILIRDNLNLPLT